MTAAESSAELDPSAARRRLVWALRAQRTLWQIGVYLALPFYLASMASLLGFVGYQAWIWLQTGEWVRMPLASFGLVRAARFANTPELEAWARQPQVWIGVHRILDVFSVGIFLAVALFIVATWFTRRSESHKHAYDELGRRREELEARIRESE